MTEDEMVGWHHNSMDMCLCGLRELVWTQGQGSLVGCRLWGHTESGTTEVT